METQNTLLYSQLQEGLKYELMKAPAVSGAKDYQELCISAKNEEHRFVVMRHWYSPSFIENAARGVDVSLFHNMLYSSDSDDSEVPQVKLVDQGSCPKRAQIEMARVPVIGVVDSGSDITIVNGELLKKVAAVVKLWKRDLKKPDKMPTTYDR